LRQFPTAGFAGVNLHFARVVGVEKVEGRSRITTLVVDAEPTVVVFGMEDKGETIVDLSKRVRWVRW
jgi:hypothetical protein